MHRIIAIVVLIYAMTFNAFGFRQKHYSKNKSISSQDLPIEDHVLRPAIENSPMQIERFGSTMIHVKYDALSHAPRVLTGSFGINIGFSDETASSQEFIQACRDFISDNDNYFNTAPEDLYLVENSTLITKVDQFIKFKVKRDGILIQDSNIDCRFKFGKLVQIINQSYSEAGFKTNEKFAKINKPLFNPKFIKNTDSEIIYRVLINEESNGYELVKVKQFEVEDKDGNRLKAQTNLITGELVELKDTKHFVTIKAESQVYPRWYGDALSYLPAGHLSIKASTGNIVTDANGESIGVESTFRPVVETLKGPFVGVMDRTNSAKIEETARENGADWLIRVNKSTKSDPWADLRLAQTMAFYHVNNMKNLARKYIQLPWLDEKLLTYTNLNQSCNAYWDGSTINFFKADSECANSAMISDVIYHEFGHGLDQNTGGIDDGAFSEGYGDILSLIMTGDNQLGIGFFLADHAPVRDLSISKIYPQDAGEVHDEGQIIGSTFYDLHEALKQTYTQDQVKDILANYAFKVIFTARTYLDVYDALLVIDDDDADLENGTPNMCVINKVFAKHGLTREMDACKLVGIDKIDIIDSNGDKILVPGESADLNVWIKNFTFRTLPQVTANISVSKGAELVTLHNTDLSWQNLGRKQSAASLNPLSLSVHPEAHCGDTFSLNFAFKADGTTVNHKKDIRLGARDGNQVAVHATGLPAAIEDYKTTEAKIMMNDASWSANSMVKELRLRFDIRHTYVGDLTVGLVDPEGHYIEVFTGSGPSDDVHFDRDISEMFLDHPAVGEWTLRVRDQRYRDQGQLDNFELSLIPTSFQCE